MPANVWLSTVSMTLATAKSGGSVTSGGGVTSGGSVTISASATDPNAPAQWIAGLRGLTSTFATVWIPSISTATQAGRTVLTFSVQATLSPGVLSTRASAYGVPK